MATETEVCNIHGAFLDKKEIHEWKEIIVHIDLTFWMAASCHKPSPSQVWSLWPHEIRDIKLCIRRDTTYDHATKGSCDFVGISLLS